jgi:ubiquinone/menaquinone biosynthesis C-methylase UbiE
MANKNPLKQMLDSRLAWDAFQGAVYNRVIWNAVGHIVEQMVDATPPPRPDARALDVGAGPGYATLLVAKKHPAAHVTGIDFSPIQVKFAKQHLRKQPAPNCDFMLGDALDLPFENESFDFVFSIASIKHWPDARQGLSEIRRVLRPGCIALIGEADPQCQKRHLDSFVQKFTEPWWVNKTVTGWYVRDIVFKESMSMADAEHAAREAGFENITMEKVGHPFWKMELIKD